MTLASYQTADLLWPGTGEAPAYSAPHEPRQKYRAREGYCSTARLERFINCWSQLEGNELKQNEVVLAGRTLSYRQAVSRPVCITPADNGARILQGGAKAMLWPKDAPKRLYLNFMSECDKFPVPLRQSILLGRHQGPRPTPGLSA